VVIQHARERRNTVIQARRALAFTIAPHLQIINYHDRFPAFVGI